MKTKVVQFKDQCAQGDVLLTTVTSIPQRFKAQTPEANDTHVVTHSETGHHHVVESKHVDFFTSANEPFVSFLKVKQPTDLRHLRDFDIHESIQLDPGMYRVNRQREFDEEGVRRVAD